MQLLVRLVLQQVTCQVLHLRYVRLFPLARLAHVQHGQVFAGFRGVVNRLNVCLLRLGHRLGYQILVALGYRASFFRNLPSEG